VALLRDRDGSGGMNPSKSLSLRENADSKKRESATAANLRQSRDGAGRPGLRIIIQPKSAPGKDCCWGLLVKRTDCHLKLHRLLRQEFQVAVGDYFLVLMGPGSFHDPLA
jgi:hypothetical protein